MRRLAISNISLLMALPLIAGGCVQQEKYDQMLMTNRALEEQVVALGDERDAARADLDTVRDSLNKATSELNGLKMKYGLVDADLQKMAADYDALMKRVSILDYGPLPAGLSHELEQLAAQHPDMLTFDAKRGMLRFASDFTFGLGSADLTSSAASSLSTLAQILNSPQAMNFEVRVIGHTDNVPISNAGTRAKHPTNWHLSAHRAISVGSTLIGSSVSPSRIQVAGYGEYRPVVPNPPKGGAAQNRRVEIFLVPMPDTTPVMAGAPTNAATIGDEPMK